MRFTFIFAVCFLLSASSLAGVDSIQLNDGTRVINFSKAWELAEYDGKTDIRVSAEMLQWKKITLPIKWTAPMPENDTGILLRQTFRVSPLLKNRNFGIYTGVIRYTCAFYLNDIQIGELGSPQSSSYPGGLWDMLTYFFIPESAIKYDGPNILCIRVQEHYDNLKFTSLAVGGIESIERLYFLDRFKFKLLHFLAGIICIILFFPLLYFFIVHRKELSYLYTFFAGFTFAGFCILVAFDVPPFDFSVFYGIAMVMVSLAISFIALAVWSFYVKSPKPSVLRYIFIIANLAIGCVYFFLPGYRPRLTFHMYHNLIVYLPQIVLVFGVVCYNRYVKKNKKPQILFYGMLLLVATTVYDLLFDITGIAPAIWLTPLGVIGFCMSLYLQVANQFIADIKVAENNSSRLLYADILIDEKERLDVTLDSIGDAVICTDTSGTITLFNKAACDMACCEKIAALSSRLPDIIHLKQEDIADALPNELENLLWDPNLSPSDPRPYILVPGIGDNRSVLLTKAEIRDKDEKVIGLVWVFHDTTGRGKLEKIYERNQTLESLGLLAGGIAHDFNAILSCIMLNINLIKKSGVATDGKLEELLADTANSISRASSLTHQLLTFAKGEVPLVQFRDIRPLIMTSASYALGGRSGVRIAYTLASDLRPAEVDAAQISQVIFNLVTNAVEALHQEGEILISGENCTIESEMPFLERGEYVLVKIADNGIGIKKEHLGRIFDPYFTTKQSGTGRGLTTVYAVIKNHKGHIEVTSEENKGATFFIYLRARKEKTECA